MLPMPSLEFVLIAARAVALVLALLMFAWAFRRWRMDVARDTQRVFEQLDLIRAELRDLSEQMQTVQEREPSKVEAPDSAARFALPAVAAGPRGYEVAVRLAKNGATRDELIANCGISRHEAELLLRLHSADKDPPMNGAKSAEASTQARESKPSSVAGANGAAPAAASTARPRLSVVG